jgi:threonine/homoserine/homoserine lactone efflux protein
LSDPVLAAAAIRWGAIAPLLITALAIMGSPGPATISLTAAGSAFGVRRSLGYLTGVVAGTAVVLLAVATGITAVLLALPALRDLLIGLAAGYILWLAYRVATAPPLGTAEGSAAPTLAGGLVLGVANPKAWLAIAAVFASSQLAGPSAVDAFLKVVLLTAMIVIVNSSWLVAGASLAPVLRDARRARVANVVLSALLVGATALVLLR